jgi:hypothetical protein
VASAAGEPPAPETRLESAGDPIHRASSLEQPPREAVTTKPPPLAAPVGAADPNAIAHQGTIEGLVVQRDGSAAREGTLVIAREAENLRADPDLAERILRRDPSVKAARCAAEGRFVLEGLSPGASYVLTAVGNGTISVQGALPVSEGTSDAKVEVALLYGIAIELRENGGGRLRTTVDPQDLSFPYTSSAAPFPDGPLMDLVGVDLSPYRTGANRRLFLFTSPKVPEPPSLERLALKFRVLGYAPVASAFDALPILPALTEHVIELRPVASGWGEIVVQFEDARDPTTEGPRVKPCRLQIASTTGPQADIELPRDPGAKHLPGIPFGRYRVSVQNALDQQIFPKVEAPSRPIEVGSTPAVITVSLLGTSRLEIEIRSGEAHLYDGPATLSLARGEPTPDGRSLVGPTATVIFDRGPYVLGALMPGHYILFVQQPAGASVLPAGSNGMFDLEAGGTRTLQLDLP